MTAKNIESVYDYTNASGDLLFQVVRAVNAEAATAAWKP